MRRERGVPASATGLRRASCWVLLPAPGVTGPGQINCCGEVGGGEVGPTEKLDQSKGIS